MKVTDKDVAAAFGLKKKGVAIVRPAIQEVVNYLPGKVTKEALISFFEDYGTPLIIDYNEGRDTRTSRSWSLQYFFPIRFKVCLSGPFIPDLRYFNDCF